MIIQDEREILPSGENCSIRETTFKHNEREFLVIEPLRSLKRLS